MSKKKDVIFCWIMLLISELYFKFCLDLQVKMFATFSSIIMFAFFMSFICFFNDKIRIKIETSLIILWNIYLFSQHYYFCFFKNFWSIFNLVQVKELTILSSEIFTKLNLGLLFYVFVTLVWLIFVKIAKTKKVENTKSSLFLFTVLGFLCFITPSFAIKTCDNSFECQTNNSAYLYNTMINKTLFMEEFGATEYIKRDISTSLNAAFKKASDEEKEMIEGWFKPLENNEYSGVLSGKNLIFIQAESLTNKAIDPILTPTLYKMTQEGIYFDNFYAPLYPANTNDSEFIFQTGLMPSIEGATTSYKCDKNFFPYSLASLFKKEGYNANSYHSFFGEFYNRNVMHETLGFDNFYSVEDLLEQYEEELKGGNFWVDDLELVKAYGKNVSEKPYYSFIITTSGHMPYSEERKGLEEKFEIVKEYWKDKYNDEIAYYEAAQMLLDDALKYLIEQNPDAVIIVVGDHYPYGLSEESQELFLEKKLLHVPFIIYNSGLEAKTFSQVRSSFDVFPTISNLFGLKTPISFGVDALSEQQSTVYLKEGTVITDDYIGVPSKMEAWEVGKLILSTNFFSENSNEGY